MEIAATQSCTLELAGTRGVTSVRYSDNCVLVGPVLQIWEWPVFDANIVGTMKDDCPERIWHLGKLGPGRDSCCECGEIGGIGKPEGMTALWVRVLCHSTIKQSWVTQAWG
jgi:hypothetical protein